MPYDRELDYTLVGIAFARNWLVGDRASSDRLLATAAELTEGENAWFEAPLRDPSTGYAAWSASYDEPGNPVVAIEGDALREQFKALRPGRALDAACGTGRHAFALEQLGHTVVGVDASETMLARAREKSLTLELRRGDLTALPLEDASVDLAVCALALTHLPDLGPPLAELARVVRPGGRVILSDVHPTNVMLGRRRCTGPPQAGATSATTCTGTARTSRRPAPPGSRSRPAMTWRTAARRATSLPSASTSRRTSWPTRSSGFPAVVVWELERH